MAKMFLVDIPSLDSQFWQEAGHFDTREEAIRFCQENFGADEDGKISLITELDLGDDEEGE